MALRVILHTLLLTILRGYSVSINVKLWSDISPRIETIRVAEERSQKRETVTHPSSDGAQSRKGGGKPLEPRLERESRREKVDDENKRRIRFFSIKVQLPRQSGRVR